MKKPSPRVSERIKDSKINKILTSSVALKLACMRINKDFEVVEGKHFVSVIIDQSMIGILGKGSANNKKLAYLGESYLNLYVTRLCHELNCSSYQRQLKLEQFVGVELLAGFYDASLCTEVSTPQGNVICCQNSSPTKKQKAICVKALVGMLYYRDYGVLAEILSSKITQSFNK